VPLAAALLTLCVLFCLFGAAASAGAATSGFSAQGPLAQHALRSSPLSAAAEVFTPFGISWTQQVGASATPGTAIVKSPRGTITTTKPTFKWSKDAGATKYELRVYKGSKLLLKKTGLKKLSLRRLRISWTRVCVASVSKRKGRHGREAPLVRESPRPRGTTRCGAALEPCPQT
jgi:hypothetical protein